MFSLRSGRIAASQAIDASVLYGAGAMRGGRSCVCGLRMWAVGRLRCCAEDGET